MRGRVVSREVLLGLNRSPPGEIYKIASTSIGDGGFGSVFAAKHKEHGEDRVIKVVEKRQRPLESFRHDFDALLTLDHPHVNRVFEFFEDRKHISVVVERVLGGELGEVLPRLAGNAKSTREWEVVVAKVAIQLLSALVHMHARGICHLDIKPENIIVADAPSGRDATPHAVLVDFGIAARTDDACEAGSVPYLPPEYFLGDFTAAPTRDTWALGCVLFKTLSGGDSPFKWGKWADNHSLSKGVAPPRQVMEPAYYPPYDPPNATHPSPPPPPY
jgi:serine/threonine protein kinase